MLVFMIQLVIAVLSYGFMVSKILQMATMYIQKPNEVLIMFSILMIFMFSLTIMIVCQQAKVNFFDKIVLLSLFGCIWVPQIAKDLF
jgi:hypothetical protein